MSPIFPERDVSQVVVDELEEMISSGGQSQLLSSDQTQQTLGSCELLERDLLPGELSDLVRLWQEEEQPQQVLQVEERRQRQILEEHGFRRKSSIDIGFLKETF